MSVRRVRVLRLGLAGLVALLGVSSHAAQDTVWMERPDGTKQCEPALRRHQKAQLLAVIRRQLRKSGIRVLEARLRHDGRMHMQSCGSPTGGVVRVRVRLQDQEKVEAAGFSVSVSNR